MVAEVPTKASRASVVSIARYWADAPELCDINSSPGQEFSVSDLRFCLERCAELLVADGQLIDRIEELAEEGVATGDLHSGLNDIKWLLRDRTALAKSEGGS